jgi:uncharacterized RDD family membrane protein YckC
VTDARATLGSPARLGRRLLSLCYEALTFAAVLLAGGFLLTLLAVSAGAVLARPVLQVILLLLAGTYFAWQWRRGGQTLAMKAWRIRLVTASGAELTWRHAILRFALAVPGVLLCGSGFLWVLIDRDRQFLHDRLAGTRIVMDEG